MWAAYSQDPSVDCTFRAGWEEKPTGLYEERFPVPVTLEQVKSQNWYLNTVTEAAQSPGSSWRPWERITFKFTLLLGRTLAHMDVRRGPTVSLAAGWGPSQLRGPARVRATECLPCSETSLRLTVLQSRSPPTPPYMSVFCFSSRQKTLPSRA